MTWPDERFTAFDIETTGLDYDTARIVTASVCYVGGGQDTVIKEWLVNPGVEIPQEATDVHGITTEKVATEGQDAASAVREILDALLCTWTGPIVAYNARFDLTILDREARRYGYVPLQDHMERAGRDLLVVDPLVLDRHLDRFRKGSRQLEATCVHYGAVLDGAHSATCDAVAAGRLAWVLAKRGSVVRRVSDAKSGWERKQLQQEWERVRYDLPALHEAQVAWAKEQAEGLSAHLRRQMKPDYVDTEWPIVSGG